MATTLKKIIASALLVIIMFTSLAAAPLQARAQTIPQNSDFDFNSIMAHLKDFTLDKLAVMIANQIIQRMTASVVNWINTGFEGSPSFLTNPEGFFLDVGDQVTGQFLHQIGASKLCSPFSLDLRLALALNYANQYPRYACTLSKAINAQTNNINNVIDNRGPRVTVTQTGSGATLNDFLNPTNLTTNSNLVSVNGQSIQGVTEFYQGNFAAGGWKSFVALSMEQQNNPNGAYLLAHSDLQRQLAARKNAINSDLNRGNGFLSWEKCENVVGDLDGYNGVDNRQRYGLNDSQVGQLSRTGNQVVNTSAGSKIRKTVDPKTKEASYKSCQTQTPGSILGGTLQRQLNVPADKLVLVKTISDSIDAVLGALVNQMLTQGLAALSSAQAGGSGKSYLRKLSDDANNKNSLVAQTTRDRLLSQSNSLMNLTDDSIAIYDQSLRTLADTKTRFTTAAACFDTKIKTITPLDPAQKAQGEAQIASINATIATRIDPLILSITEKKQAALTRLEELREITATTTSGSNIQEQSADDIFAQVQMLEAYIGSVTKTTRAVTTTVASARQESTAVTKDMETLNKEAAKYQNACALFPTVIIP